MTFSTSGDPYAPRDQNKTALEAYLEFGFVAANTLILLVTFFVGIAANIFVLLAVYKQKSLQTSNNALVVNLAVIDFLRCVIDCPVLLTIVITVNRTGRGESMICDLQLASFSFSCCIQLLTLACISAERYQAISQPFKTVQRRRRVTVLIPSTWIIAIGVSLVCLLFLKDSPVYVRCQGARNGPQTSYDKYGLYVVLPLWAACFSVIIGFYGQIFMLVKSHNRKIFDQGITAEKANEKKEESKQKGVNIIQVEPMATKAAQKSPDKDAVSALLTPKLPQCIPATPGNEKGNALEVIELEQPCEEVMQDREKVIKSGEPTATAVNEDATNGVKSPTFKLQQMSNEQKEAIPGENAQNDKSFPETNPLVQSVGQTPDPEPVTELKPDVKAAVEQASPVTATEVDAPAQNIEGAVCIMPSKANRERASKKKEGKLAKRAGYIIVTFLLFWLPIITTIILNFALHGNTSAQMSVIQDLEVLSVSVACVTSLSNPIIYAAVNPQFRAEFHRLKNKVKSMSCDSCAQP